MGKNTVKIINRTRREIKMSKLKEGISKVFVRKDYTMKVRVENGTLWANDNKTDNLLDDDPLRALSKASGMRIIPMSNIPEISRFMFEYTLETKDYAARILGFTNTEEMLETWWNVGNYPNRITYSTIYEYLDKEKVIQKRLTKAECNLNTVLALQNDSEQEQDEVDCQKAALHKQVCKLNKALEQLNQEIRYDELLIDKYSLKLANANEALHSEEPILGNYVEEPNACSRINALAEFMDVPVEYIKEDTQYGETTYLVSGKEFLVYTDEESNEKTAEYIKYSLWAFQPAFIIEHSSVLDKDKGSYKILEAIQEQCEEGNDAVTKLIDDVEDFVADAISTDGRGHFLNTYDSEEYSATYKAEKYFIYRTN